MDGWAQQERESLCSRARELGPDAATLVPGWTTSDLMAHLYVREHRLDAAPGVLLGRAAAAYTDRVMASVLRVHGYTDVVSRVASGPPAVLRPVDELINLFEFFVHYEDVRRAQGDSPRHLPAELETLLWKRLRLQGRLLFRRTKNVRIELASRRGEEHAVGKGPVVRVFGAPGELVLFAFDRKDAADVELTGDDAAVRRLRATRLGP